MGCKNVTRSRLQTRAHRELRLLPVQRKRNEMKKKSTGSRDTQTWVFCPFGALGPSSQVGRRRAAVSQNRAGPPERSSLHGTGTASPGPPSRTLPALRRSTQIPGDAAVAAKRKTADGARSRQINLGLAREKSPSHCVAAEVPPIFPATPRPPVAGRHGEEASRLQHPGKTRRHPCFASFHSSPHLG